MPSYQNWLLEVNDRIAILTLNRAAHRNSLTPGTFQELREITRELRVRRDVWAVVVQADGDHFSTGVDVSLIGARVGMDKATFAANLREQQTCLDEFEALDKPTIAKLHGWCLGGGLLLALCCDFRIASERTRFGLPEVKRGVAVIMGTPRITRMVGTAKAKELILLAEFFDAKQAHALGLVHQVVPADQLDTAVLTLAAKFRHLPPRTVSFAKQLIDQSHLLNVRDSEDLEIAGQAELLNDADFKEAIDSFFEKRPAVFKGE